MSAFSDVLKGAVDLIKAEEKKAAIPALLTFLGSIAKDHTAANIAVQLLELQTAILAAQPQIETDVLTYISTAATAALGGGAGTTPSTPAS